MGIPPFIICKNLQAPCLGLGNHRRAYLASDENGFWYIGVNEVSNNYDEWKQISEKDLKMNWLAICNDRGYTQ